MTGTPAPPARRAVVRRALGRVLPIAGWVLVVGNVLVMTGLVPLWRPSLPEPSVLRAAEPPARSAGWSPADWLAFARPRATSLPAPPAAVPDPPERPIAGDGPALAQAGPPPPAPPAPTTTPIVLPTAVPPLPPPGPPVHLIIPSIRLDTPVVELRTTYGSDGGVEWETVPFVAGHYGTTGLAGARTNMVLSGHVVTTDRGNVFRDLYQVRPGEPVVVYTDKGQFTYRIVDVRLVKPSDVSVLAPSAEPRLTLVTCAGQFDYRTHTFSERLIVTGQLVTL